LVLVLVGVAAVGCEQTHGLPTPLVLRLTAIVPAKGTTFGGTPVTITGSGFGASASVTIGGAAAANVVVVNATTITAVTPQHPVGGSDVVVTSEGRSGALLGGFIFEVPPAGPNSPPEVTGLTAQGTRSNQPAGMADLNETINVSALVTDTETPPDALTYEWTATAGAFQGTGRAVGWRAPASLVATPVDVTLTLTVIERFTLPDPQGLPTPQEHRVTRTVGVRVHDSVREITDLAVDFLAKFSNSNLTPDQVMSEFSRTCGGGGPFMSELADVQKNRCLYTITSHSLGTSATTQQFRGLCTILSGVEQRSHIADGCATVPVRWVSVIRPGALSCPVQETMPGGGPLVPGMQVTTTGIDMVTAMYEGNRWRLCHSDFAGQSTSPIGTFQGFKK
jgi:hypothetical protein